MDALAQGEMKGLTKRKRGLERRMESIADEWARCTGDRSFWEHQLRMMRQQVEACDRALAYLASR